MCAVCIQKKFQDGSELDNVAACGQGVTLFRQAEQMRPTGGIGTGLFLRLSPSADIWQLQVRALRGSFWKTDPESGTQSKEGHPGCERPVCRRDGLFGSRQARVPESASVLSDVVSYPPAETGRFTATGVFLFFLSEE